MQMRSRENCVTASVQTANPKRETRNILCTYCVFLTLGGGKKKVVLFYLSSPGLTLLDKGMAGKGISDIRIFEGQEFPVCGLGLDDKKREDSGCRSPRQGQASERTRVKRDRGGNTGRPD